MTTVERRRTDPKTGSPGGRLTFDRSRAGRRGVLLPELDVPQAAPLPDRYVRRELNLPEMSQNEIVRYFLGLSRLNYSIDTGFYPLGSCTMKYNPKVNEDVAGLPGFAGAHPHQPAESVQGVLAVLYELQEALAEITGMDAVSLAPAAGAQGELCGILMIKQYLAGRGETHRRRVLVPDSAHGTNPATAAMAGFEVVSVPSGPQGNTDLAFLSRALDDGVAAMMLTLPSTLGLFDPNIGRIAAMLHERGALLYGDGANQNAFLGRARFGDMGFDVVHLNLHKTFSTPHGGGGPGAGPVCAAPHLAPYLPAPIVERAGPDPAHPEPVEGSARPEALVGRAESPRLEYRFATPEKTIGKTMAFHGNFGVLLRALTYIKSLGGEGLRAVSENAVINANYVLSRLRAAYKLPYERPCMHEVVLSGSVQRARGVKTLDIAKRLIDYGYHPPTIYFPLIVDEALMIEPTETEGKEALDAFCEAMLAIAREVEEDPELVKGAPYTAPLRRLDEATAARKPVLRWRPAGGRT
ncbi:MAG: aminomethyl-transferring glycine dehydrogenase subunit GcvPB [Dehalococcoidia bacterium]|nr:aminomethyl-transferring glycine dehydrogenase subunit GcvPB [Dehalococcoidia bacterium]